MFLLMKSLSRLRIIEQLDKVDLVKLSRSAIFFIQQITVLLEPLLQPQTVLTHRHQLLRDPRQSILVSLDSEHVPVEMLTSRRGLHFEVVESATDADRLRSQVFPNSSLRR